MAEPEEFMPFGAQAAEEMSRLPKALSENPLPEAEALSKNPLLRELMRGKRDSGEVRLWEAVGDVAMSLPRGVAKLKEETSIGLERMLGASPRDPIIPGWMGTAKTGMGRLTESVVQFAVPWAMGAGALRLAGTTTTAIRFAPKAGMWLMRGQGGMATVARDVVAGGPADFFAYGGLEERFSNLIEDEMPEWLSTSVTRYLASDPNDGELEGRFKHMLEGGILGGTLGTLIFRMARGIRKVRGAAQIQEARRPLRSVENANIEAAMREAEKQSAEVRTILRLVREAEPSEKQVSAVAEEIADRLRGRGVPVDMVQVKLRARDKLKGELKAAGGKLLRTGARPKVVKQEPRNAILDDDGAREFQKGFVGADPDDAYAYEKAFARMFINVKNISPEQIHAIIASFARALPKGVSILDHAQRRVGNKEILETAALLGVDSQQLLEILSHAAKVVKTLESELVAGKGLFVKLLDETRLKAIQVEMAAADDVLVREEFKNLMDVTYELGVSLKGIITGTARTTAAGRIRIKMGRLMRRGKDFDAMSPAQQDLFLRSFARADDAIIAKKLLEQSLGGKILGIHNELMINAMLSGFTTQTVNIISQLLKVLALPAELVVGAGGAAVLKGVVRPILSKGYRESIPFWGGTIKEDLRTMQFGMMLYHNMAASAAEAVSLGWKTIFSETPILTRKASLVDSPQNLTRKNLTTTLEMTNLPKRVVHGAAWAGHYLGKASRLLSTSLLMGADEGFKQMSYRGYLRTKLWKEAIDQGKQGVEIARHVSDGFEDAFDDLGRGLDKEALDFASDATFQNELATGTFGRSVQNLVNSHPGMVTVMPFVRTPVNIARDVWARTPGVQFAQKEFRRQIFSTNHMERSQALGKLNFGLALWVGLGMAAYSGRLTGKGPSNKRNRNMLRQTGWRPYSIVLGPLDNPSGYLSYHRLDPWAMIAGLAADASEIFGHVTDGERKGVAGIMSVALVNNLASKTYLSGLIRFVDAINNIDYKAEGYFQSYFASFVPNSLRSVNLDPLLREARSIIDRAYTKIPGLSATLPPRRNILGEPIERFPPGYSWQTINPFFLSPTSKDPVFRELAGLGHGFSLSPEKVGSIDLLSFSNSNGETAYDRWTELMGTVTIGGKSVRNRLERLISDRRFQRLPKDPLGPFDSPRIDMVRNIISKYRRAAWRKMRDEFPEVARISHADSMMRSRRGRSLPRERAQQILDRTGMGTTYQGR